MDGLSHFERAALVACVDQMRRLDWLTAAMYARVAYLRGQGGDEEGSDPPRIRSVFDPDRFLYAFRCFVALWAAYLTVIYIPDFPAAVMFIVLTVSLGLALTAMPQLSATMAQKPIFMGLVVIAAVYMFVMPRLSTFLELTVVLFALVFGIACRFPLPTGVLYRTTWLPLLVTILGVSNQQSYSFPYIASTAIAVLVMLWLVTLTGYLPVSVQPKNRFRAQLRRFFRSAGFLLGASQWRDRNPRSWMARERERFHANEVATIPTKMAARCPALQAMAGPEGVTNAAALVGALQGLRRQIVEVHAAREVIRLQAAALPESLRRELDDWRDSLEQLFARLQTDPRILDSAALDERLDAGVGDLEAEVSKFLESRAATGPDFNEQELYRLLAALRDISTSLVAYARRAEAFDWNRAYENRF